MTAGTNSAWRSLATSWIALAIVASDALASALRIDLFDGLVLALTGTVAVLCLNDGNLPSLGMRLAPIQGWWYWCRIALWFGAAIGVILALCAGVWHLLGWTIPFYRSPPSLHRLFFMCVYAPVAEEVVYRALLTVAVLPTLGVRGTILVSGFVFAAAHVLRGIPSPENQVAGFLLAWALLHSKTILVPIAMHSAGNFIALAGQVAGWYWLPPVS